MSSSTKRVPYVLMYDTRQDQCFWVTPARSWLLLAANPTYERIELDDPAYCAYIKIAPPKPVHYYRTEEDFIDES